MPIPEPNNALAKVVEAMLTVGEIRKPGYVQKVMDQLQDQAPSVVAELRPAEAAADGSALELAVSWLRQASVRARATAAERQRRKRETR